MDTWDCLPRELEEDLQPSRFLSQPPIKPVNYGKKEEFQSQDKLKEIT